jgi:copper chaperone CopZ
MLAFAFSVSLFADEIKIKTSSHCDMCKGKIEKGLLKVKGVEKADLNLETKVVTVNFDAKKTNPDALLKKVEKLGYTASFATDNAVTEKPKDDKKCCKDGDHKCKKDGKCCKDGKCKKDGKCCKDGDHKCKKDGDHKCCKDGDHKCKKDGDHKCCKDGEMKGTDKKDCSKPCKK